MSDTASSDNVAGEQDESLNTAINAILSTDADIFGGYPVDENFLMYLANRYGIEKLFEITDALEEEQDIELWYTQTGNSIHVLMYDYYISSGMRVEYEDRYRIITPASEDETVLAFTGDMNFDDSLATMANYRQNGLSGILDEGLRDLMKNVDIMTVNCECSLSERGEPLDGKSFTFRGKPENASIMAKLGVDVASIANNHIYDYGPDALVDTYDAIEAAGILPVGAGNDLEQAMEPVCFIANGRKISIVAATQIERTYNYTRQATADTPGVLKTYDPGLFCEVIKKADANSDVVIAYVHWGTEKVNYVDESQLELAKAFVEAGADAVIGAHPHVLQGLEFVEQVPVAYSLGNFWFGSTSTDGHNKRDTAVAEIVIKKNGELLMKFLPCVQQDFATSLITDPEEYKRIKDYEQSISRRVKIDTDGTVINNKSLEE